MKSNKIYLRTSLCILIISCTIGLVVWLKLLLIFVADTYLYTIPFLGDILRSIEIIELANLVVFAILGMLFGVATALLPKNRWRYINIILLIIIVPILFSITSFVRYREWLQAVAVEEKISYAKAKALTNSYLQDKVGERGFWGFYLYTAKFPIVPTNNQQMNELEDMDQRIKSGLTKLLRNVLGYRPNLVNFLFAIQGWIIRTFYFLIAVFATLFHFQDGVAQSEKRTSNVDSQSHQ